MLPSHTHHDSLQLKIVLVAIKELSESRRNVRASFHVGLEGYVCSSHIVQVPMVFQLETVTLWQSVHRNLRGILEKLPKTSDETNGWDTMTQTELV